jgi:hypothetical protein
MKPIVNIDFEYLCLPGDKLSAGWRPKNLTPVSKSDTSDRIDLWISSRIFKQIKISLMGLCLGETETFLKPKISWHCVFQGGGFISNVMLCKGLSGYIITTKYVHTSWQSSSWTAHCNENPMYVFPEKELPGLGPNFNIHVSVSDLYMPKIGPHIFLEQNIVAK